ncbi:MAG: hypothetical protein FWG89_05910 [Treponema sp.]|nr:hypothetical protein [Treponema sp.]
MDNNEVLDHLLKIESEAARFVNDAQADASTKMTEAEKYNRAVFEKRYREENEKFESNFAQSVELAQQRYRAELEAYNQKISSFETDVDGFSAMMDKLVFSQRGRL